MRHGQRTEEMVAVLHRQTGVAAMLTGFVPSGRGTGGAF